jgi:hypothetical protein
MVRETIVPGPRAPRLGSCGCRSDGVSEQPEDFHPPSLRLPCAVRDGKPRAVGAGKLFAPTTATSCVERSPLFSRLSIAWNKPGITRDRAGVPRVKLAAGNAEESVVHPLTRRHFQERLLHLPPVGSARYVSGRS